MAYSQQTTFTIPSEINADRVNLDFQIAIDNLHSTSLLGAELLLNNRPVRISGGRAVAHTGFVIGSNVLHFRLRSIVPENFDRPSGLSTQVAIAGQTFASVPAGAVEGERRKESDADSSLSAAAATGLDVSCVTVTGIRASAQGGEACELAILVDNSTLPCKDGEGRVATSSMCFGRPTRCLRWSQNQAGADSVPFDVSMRVIEADGALPENQMDRFSPVPQEWAGLSWPHLNGSESASGFIPVGKHPVELAI